MTFPQGCAVPLILASSSSIRKQMLDAAGVAHQAIAPGLDESRLKREIAGPEVAEALAKAKAVDVSKTHPSRWVIGSDSVLCIAGQRYSKPASRDEAAEHLRGFSGQTMELTSAVALAQDGQVDWSHSQKARLHVRALSEDFIQSYLDLEWPEVSYCVGVFRLEGPGVQLFERIDGDYFTILGMPLLPLLGALRERELLDS